MLKSVKNCRNRISLVCVIEVYLMKYHFQVKKGWINDPNGLSYYNNKYHMFFQHNPYDVVWDKMHWGHAVSTDLINWTELSIALYPEAEYEQGLGCFSGSAIVREDKLHIFYTSVDKEKNQSQSHAIMDKAGIITRCEGNPFLRMGPGIDPKEFRDPKVVEYKGEYLMALGTGTDGIGRVVLYASKDLYNWEYRCVLVEGTEYGPVIECPDFFWLDGKFVLILSTFMDKDCGTRALVGSFDGKAFKVEKVQRIDDNRHFYAPQSFSVNERRIQIGWLRDIYKTGSPCAGAMSIARELKIRDGELRSFPVEEAFDLLAQTDNNYEVFDNKIVRKDINKIIFQDKDIKIREIDFLRDEDLVEIFINHGEKNLCVYEGLDA